MHEPKTTQHQGAIEAAREGAAAPWPGCAFGRAVASRVSRRGDGDVLAPAQVPGFAVVSSGGAAYVVVAADTVATVVAFAPPVVVTTGTRTLPACAAGKAAAALAAGKAANADAYVLACAAPFEPSLELAGCLQRRGSVSPNATECLAESAEAGTAGQIGEAGQVTRATGGWRRKAKAAAWNVEGHRSRMPRHRPSDRPAKRRVMMT